MATLTRQTAQKVLEVPVNDHRPKWRIIVRTLTLSAGLLVLVLWSHYGLRLSTTILMGADEGFELAKSVLLDHAHRLYSDVWNDQPPLHTFIIAGVLRPAGNSVMGPRLLTFAWAAVMLCALFLIFGRLSGWLAAGVGAALLTVAPGFLGLSASCMLEIPAVAPAIAASCIIVVFSEGKLRVRDIIAGALFGISALTKLVPLYLLPLVALAMWSQTTSLKDLRDWSSFVKSLVSFVPAALAFGSSSAVTFAGLDYALERGAFIRHFGQTWRSHFAPAISSEYGSPSDYPFDWSVLLKHWDATAPAVLAICVIVMFVLKPRLKKLRSTSTSHRSRGDTPNRKEREACPSQSAPAAKRKSDDPALPLLLQYGHLLPIVWLAWSLLIFGIHRPWWPYYYVHTAIPLCWCAGIGVAALVRLAVGRSSIFETTPAETPKLPPLGRRWATALLAAYVVCAVPWVTARMYLQISSIRNSPQTYNSPVLTELRRFKPLAQWLYTDEPIYSFHAGIPMPPDLAVVMLKRFWSGEMTNARLTSELREYKPGLVLVHNDTRVYPFQDFLNTDYRLVYIDAAHRLYAHKSIADKAVY